MKLLIQRSLESNVSIHNKIVGAIEKGLVVFVGFYITDTEKNVDELINKLINLRIFNDKSSKMNLSLLDVGGSILSISQFTLYADCTRGRRPSFIDAKNSLEASKLYDLFNDKLKEKNVHVETGVFGEDMLVNIKNDGPITICLESR